MTNQYPDAELSPAEPPGRNRPRYSRLWGFALVLTVIVGCGTGDSTATDEPPFGAKSELSEPTPTRPGPTDGLVPQEVEQEPPGLGQEATDGNLTFVVTAVEDGPLIIGTPDLGTEAQGKFVLVTMTVTNYGDSPRTIVGDNQFLIDTEGQKASADTEAAVYLSNAASLLEEIKPGNTVTGVVVFDIPANATPAGIELHDSAFSDGVVVAVG